MSAIFAWPAELKWRDPGTALTFVVPAQQCNLSCGFCAIGQRREMRHSALRPEDYVHFIEDIVAAEPTAIISIQGHEPLLDESWAYTKAILDTARRLGVPRSLVSNGILLEARATDLRACDPSGLTVSIDSASPETHDKLRGKAGALEQTLRGIDAVAGHTGFIDRVTVSSVLLPRRPQYLHDMPGLLAELGVRHWAISPLLKIGTGEVGGPAAPTAEIIDAVLDLHERAEKYGVELVLDDELARLQLRQEDYRSFLVRRFERPGGLVRLSPSGACAIGSEILTAVDTNSPIWKPAQVAPSRFLAKVRAAHAASEALKRAA